MTLDPDTLNRTLKLEMDSGRARSIAEAQELAGDHVLQVLVGADVSQSQTKQAALLTAVNAGSRAFFGGVRVHLTEDFAFSTPWYNGRLADEALREFHGVSFTHGLDPDRPVVVIGDATWEGDWPLYVTWEGWSAGVVPGAADRLPEREEHTLSGVLAGAIAVSEAFQWARGYHVAGARAVGLSLWKPDADWRSAEAQGEPLSFLPDNLWLLGLGHLGQAYAWGLGFLPYADRAVVRIMLQDYDEVVEANESTSMLVRTDGRGLKTRLVAEALEKLGFLTRVTERAFDKHTQRSPNEPKLALSGFDGPEPRQLLEQAGFSYIVDAGLGSRAEDYLGIRVHTFPASRPANEIFNVPMGAPDLSVLDQPGYRTAVEEARYHDIALTEDAARCGILEVAGRSVGAAFVGCVAAALAISELIRMLADAPRAEVVDISLRSPQHVQAAPNQAPLTDLNPGFVRAATLAAL